MLRFYCSCLLVFKLLLLTTHHAASSSDPIRPPFGSTYPLKVDVSFMVADLKYNATDGIKICEIQAGISSSFKGSDFLNHGIGQLEKTFVSSLSENFSEIYFFENELPSPYMIYEGLARGWKKLKPYLFLVKPAPHLSGPSDALSTYNRLLIPLLQSNIDFVGIKKKYHDLLILGEATYPYRNNKALCHNLFELNDTLRSFRPICMAYKKTSDPSLAEQILNDLPFETFVIKPTSAWLGNGVIIVERENLKTTLDFIFTKTRGLRDHPDEAYSYWYVDSSPLFLVEEFVPSDPLIVPHLENQLFDPTMRVAFLLFCDYGNVSVQILYHYWKLPRYSLNSSAPLNQLHKSCGKPPYFAKVSKDIIKKIDPQLELCCTLFYQEMLERRGR